MTDFFRRITVNRKLPLSLLFVLILAVGLCGSQNASAQVTLSWTPYLSGPYQAYPGGSTADNVFVLKATGPDTWSGMNITITGPNASAFQQDSNVTPACFRSFLYPQCAEGIYFAAPTTPGQYTATLTATYTDTVTNVAGSATFALVGNVIAPPTPSGSPNLSFVPPTTIYSGTKAFGYSGNGGPANLAELSAPADIVFDSAGNAYIADKQNYVVRKVNTSGIISVYAGTPQHGGDGQYTGEGGPATSATLQGPVSLALDKAGNLYIGDGFTSVRVVNATTQKITTYAGSITYAYGYSGDGGPATSALLYYVSSLAIDSKGNLYILETGSGDIRKVDTSGNISTYAGKNQFYNASATAPNFEGTSGDGGPAAAATFYRPNAIAIDASDDIYVADGGDRVRRIDGATAVITTVAGIGAASPYQTAAQTGTESTPALQAEFYAGAVTLDSTGNIYIADSVPVANVGGPILKVDTTGTITQYPSTTSAGYGGYLRTDSTGALYIMDQITSTIYKVGAQGALAFGSVNVGSTSTAQFLTLQNNGSSAINFNTTPYAISGNFAIGNSGTCSFSAPLAVGANCTVAVTFSPLGPGTLTGTITFAYGTSTLVANLTGTGVGVAVPAVTFNPTSVAFGNQAALTTSGATVVMISNTGSATLNISNIGLAGTNPTDFGLNTSGCGSTLTAGNSCSVSVTFTPASATTYSATISVTDNASGSPQTVPLSGTGTAVAAPVAALTPTSVPFANQTVNTTSAAQNLTLSNTGNATLNITSIALTGANTADFAIANAAGGTTCGNTLAATATCNITVTFTPASPTSFTAAVTVTDNSATTTQVATLSGTGVSVGTSSFGVAGTPSTQTVNPGALATFTINVTSVSGTFSNPVTLSVTGLPTGAVATFSPPTVTPGTAGATSTLTIQTSAQYAVLSPRSRSTAPLWALLLLPSAWLLRRKRTRRSPVWLALLLLTGASLGLSSCSGGYFGPPPQSFPLTVTGTASAVQQFTTVTLNVQ